MIIQLMHIIYDVDKDELNFKITKSDSMVIIGGLYFHGLATNMANTISGQTTMSDRHFQMSSIHTSLHL